MQVNSRHPCDALIKGALYRIWCGVNRLGDSGVNRLDDTSAFVIPAGQLLLTRRGKTRMYTVGVTLCRRLSRVFICLFGSVGSFRVRVFVVVLVTSGKMATAVL